MASASALRSVFISYSSKDKEFAWRLVDDLRLNGLRDSIWIDKDFIEAGQSGWREQIVKELNYCRVALCVLSGNYFESVPCAKEANGLSEREERREDLVIIPLRYTMDPMPEKFQWVFDSSKQWVDFSEKGTRAQPMPGNYRTAFKALLEPLCKTLGVPVPRELVFAEDGAEPARDGAAPASSGEAGHAGAGRPGPAATSGTGADAEKAAARSREYLEQLDEKVQEECKAYFRCLDANGDALVTLDDLNVPFQSNRVKIAAFMSAFGLKLNGRLEARPFVERMVEIKALPEGSPPAKFAAVVEALAWLEQAIHAEAAGPRARAEALFRYYDRNASGGLSFEEVLAVVQAFREAELTEDDAAEIRLLFDAVDENLDEEISLEEFVGAIEKLPEFASAWEQWEMPSSASLGPPVNGEGTPMKRGNLGGLYYCGRHVGRCRCGGCDGRCGPGNGCQCAACEAAEAERAEKGDAPRFKSARHEHELALQVQESYTGETWSCNVCKVRVKRRWRGKAFHCPPCRFDMCWGCYKKESGVQE